MKYFETILLILLAQISFAQSHPYEIKFSHEIEADLANKKITPSRAGLLYSFIGDYNNSIQFVDIPVSWKIDTLMLDRYSIDKALNKIVNKAKEHEIVIISENHLRPQHRIFAEELIIELSKNGYKHLGMETLASISNDNNLLDTHLNERGYALNNPLTGTYTLEPQMGNLVRNALEMNINLFPYEERKKIKGKDREEVQADNIIKFAREHPNEKIIILCGFHHAIESNLIKRNNSKYMAKYLKDKLRIDPLTIYQDNFTEKMIEEEHPIHSSINISEPSIFVDQNNNNVKLSEHIDIEVIHPKTFYISNRPNWVFRNGKYKPIQIDVDNIDIDFPIIVEAFLTNEENSVPVDRIELKHKNANKVLALKKGEYRIVLQNGEMTTEYQQSVK